MHSFAASSSSLKRFNRRSGLASPVTGQRRVRTGKRQTSRATESDAACRSEELLCIQPYHCPDRHRSCTLLEPFAKFIVVDRQKCEDKIRLAEACALIIYPNEYFSDVLFGRLFRRYVLRMSTVGKRYSSIESARSRFRSTALRTARLRCGLCPATHSSDRDGSATLNVCSQRSVTSARHSGSFRMAASATSNRPSRGRKAIVTFRVSPSFPTIGSPFMTAYSDVSRC